MAQNIYNISDYIEIVCRIKSLQPENERQWGIMTLPQMLQHCSIQLKMALRILPEGAIESTFLYRTALGRWLSLYVIPWPKGFGTPTAMDMSKNNVVAKSFEEEKQELLDMLLLTKLTINLAPHHFYGSISHKDWGRLIWVHLNHHLKQFDA